MVALRYYATGKMQLYSGDNFDFHQLTVSRIIQKVTTTLGQPHIVRRLQGPVLQKGTTKTYGLRPFY